MAPASARALHIVEGGAVANGRTGALSLDALPGPGLNEFGVFRNLGFVRSRGQWPFNPRIAEFVHELEDLLCFRQRGRGGLGGAQVRVPREDLVLAHGLAHFAQCGQHIFEGDAVFRAHAAREMQLGGAKLVLFEVGRNAGRVFLRGEIGLLPPHIAVAQYSLTLRAEQRMERFEQPGVQVPAGDVKGGNLVSRHVPGGHHIATLFMLKQIVPFHRLGGGGEVFRHGLGVSDRAVAGRDPHQVRQPGRHLGHFHQLPGFQSDGFRQFQDGQELRAASQPRRRPEEPARRSHRIVGEMICVRS